MDGDEKSAAIAAASIVAKVTRDRLMRRLDALYPAYGFAQHVGYITPGHSAVVREIGPSRSAPPVVPGALLSVNAAERRAARWYRLRGWRILGTNVWAGRNEIDLVARRGRQLRFVEVKEKTGPRFGDPAEMVTRRSSGACAAPRRRGSRRIRRCAASTSHSTSSPCARGGCAGFPAPSRAPLHARSPQAGAPSLGVGRSAL